jgi:putative transposase
MRNRWHPPVRRGAPPRRLYGLNAMNSPSEVFARGLRDWPHSPVHRLSAPGAYIVTSGTYRKEPFFASSARLTFLTNSLLELAEKYAWSLQAWAVFANHYHFVAESQQPKSLRMLTRHLHSATARQINQLGGLSDRKIWFQYWETHLTYHKSYLVRLSYVHGNPVRHGIVRQAEQYPWCSAGWFRRRAPRAFYRTVMEFPHDEVIVPDDFGVMPECGVLVPPSVGDG